MPPLSHDHPTMTIERLDGAEDLDAVVALEAASFSNPWTRAMLERELEPPTAARVYVLRLPGVRVAAFCACWVIGGELHVNTIAVDPARRRQGLGAALMRYVLHEVEDEGVSRATLEVRPSNQPALELYKRLGFTVAAVRPRYYTHPEEDALILWRDRPGTPAASVDTGEPYP
jgi:ribosomal-protein-alanine N-acetyltransferase